MWLGAGLHAEALSPTEGLQSAWSLARFHAVTETRIVAARLDWRWTIKEEAMSRTVLVIAAGAFLSIGCAGAALANGSQVEDVGRLVIVNGNTHQVIYDDGRDDLFCVTRRVVVGYTEDGRRIYRRTMRCR